MESFLIKNKDLLILVVNLFLDDIRIFSQKIKEYFLITYKLLFNFNKYLIYSLTFK